MVGLHGPEVVHTGNIKLEVEWTPHNTNEYTDMISTIFP